MGNFYNDPDRDYVHSQVENARREAATDGADKTTVKIGNSNRLNVPVAALGVIEAAIMHARAAHSGVIKPQAKLYYMSKAGREALDFVFEVDPKTGEFLNDFTGNYMSAQDAIDDQLGDTIDPYTEGPDFDESRVSNPTHSDLLVLANTPSARCDWVRALPYVVALDTVAMVELLHTIHVAIAEGGCDDWRPVAKGLALLIADMHTMVSSLEILAILELLECIA